MIGSRDALALIGLWIMTTASSCATTGGEPPVKTVFVDRAVAVSCVPADMVATPGTPPPTRAALAALPDDAARYQALAEFWTPWAPWIAVAVPILDGCQQAALATAKPAP